MRLEWVERRLQSWAAWVEERQGYVKPVRLDDVPGGGSAGDTAPRDCSKEEATQRTLCALYTLEKNHVSAETLALVYLIAPQHNKSTISDTARWVGLNEKTLMSRLVVAEKKFANLVDSAKDSTDKT